MYWNQSEIVLLKSRRELAGPSARSGVFPTHSFEKEVRVGLTEMASFDNCNLLADNGDIWVGILFPWFFNRQLAERWLHVPCTRASEKETKTRWRGGRWRGRGEVSIPMPLLLLLLRWDTSVGKFCVTVWVCGFENVIMKKRRKELQVTFDELMSFWKNWMMFH